MSIDQTTLDELINEIEEATHEPLDQLSEAVANRDHLSELAEALLDHFVSEAREAGHTWSEIGDVLGITRQAAQQRAAAVPGMARRILIEIDPPEWEGRGRRGRGRGRGRGLFHRLDPDVRELITRAREMADHDQRQISTLHLLGAVAAGDGKAATALHEAGITSEIVDAALATSKEARGTYRGGRGRFGQGARKVIELALRESIRLDSSEINDLHLVLGIIRANDTRAADLLVDQNVDLGHLRTTIETAATPTD